jgi:hypothetical protein
VLNELEKTVADEQGEGEKGLTGPRTGGDLDVFSFAMHGDILSEGHWSRL